MQDCQKAAKPKLVKEKKKKPCPTCRHSAVEANEVPVTKSFLESMRRSIEYCIREETQKTRAVVAANSNSAQIGDILQECSIKNLPKTDLQSFVTFEDELTKDVELAKKLVRIASQSV